ncbi:MAG: alpha/beta hydrolase [Bacteroidota bacterium]|nr:alpha/beta hydrolase [Bacteroidota bacterium]
MNVKRLSLAISFLAVGSFLFAQATEKQLEIPRDTSYSVARVFNQIKKDFPYAVPAKDSLPGSVLGERNLVYATLPETPFGKRDLHLDLFQPRKAGKYPALIMVHGGGWRSGNKSMQVPMAQLIAAKGYVTVAVEYQLSLEAQYPAAIHNIKAAIRWMRANADKYGIDTSHIAISGCSAGGQLAALVGATNGLEKFEGKQGNNGFSSAVQAVIDIDGVLDFMAPASLNLNRKPDSPDISWLGGSFNQKPEIWKEASSIFWINKSSVPVLFINSGFSRFHAGQDEMIGIMKELNIYTEVHKFDVKMHPFWLFHPWVDQTTAYMADFMKKVFGN